MTTCKAVTTQQLGPANENRTKKKRISSHNVSTHILNDNKTYNNNNNNNNSISNNINT